METVSSAAAAIGNDDRQEFQAAPPSDDRNGKGTGRHELASRAHAKLGTMSPLQDCAAVIKRATSRAIKAARGNEHY